MVERGPRLVTPVRHKYSLLRRYVASASARATCLNIHGRIGHGNLRRWVAGLGALARREMLGNSIRICHCEQTDGGRGYRRQDRRVDHMHALPAEGTPEHVGI